MIDKLRKIIIDDYIKNKKTIDKMFYKRITDVYIEQFDLKKYVRGIKFKSLKKDGELAAYNGFTNKIIVDIDAIKRGAEELLPCLPREFSEEEKEAFIYFLHATTIFHELVHAIQEKDLGEKNIENVPEGRRRLYVCVDPTSYGNRKYSREKHGTKNALRTLFRWNKFRNKVFGCDVLSERDAEMQSYSVAQTILKGLEDEYPNLKRYMFVKVQAASIMGYDYNSRKEVESPLHSYARVLIKNDLIDPDNIAWSCENIQESTKKACELQPSLSERLKAGLPITREEHKRALGTFLRYFDEGYITHIYGSPNQNKDLNLKYNIPISTSCSSESRKNQDGPEL